MTDEKSQFRPPAAEEGFLPRPRWAILTLAAAAAYAPASLFAEQGHLLARGYRLVPYTVVVSLVLGLAAIGLAALPVRRAAAWFAVALGWVLISAGAPLIADLGGVVTVALLVVLVVVVLALGRSRFLDTLMVGVTAYLILAPATTLLGGRPVGELDVVANDATQIEVDRAADTPDVWFIVLDGYPSGASLQADFGDPGHRLAENLSALGFTVEPNALAPYSRTVGALPAVLDGSMVIPSGSVVDTVDMLAAREVVGGGSALVEGMEAARYHITMIEAGWHISRCGPNVDTCHESGLVDDMASALLSGSAIPRLFGVDNDIGTLMATLRTFDLLEQLSEELSDNDRPDLVIAHSLAPHPPMLLDAECRRTGPSPARSGRVLATPDMDADTVADRAAAFVDQVACVDKLVTELVSELPSNDAVVILGDHGSEISGQAAAVPSEWTLPMMRERLLTLAAIRVPSCTPTVDATIELVATLFQCLGMEGPSEVPLSSRIMANIDRPDGSPYAVVEIPSDAVSTLLAE